MEIGLFSLGILAGVLSGLFGIGGGILIVPVLLLIFKMNLLTANATSLAALLLPVGLLGVIQYYKAGLIKIKPSLYIAFGLFIGSFAGAEIAVNISNKALEIGYIVFLIYVCCSFWGLFDWLFKKSKLSNQTLKIQHGFVSLFITGIMAGIIAGMFGKGGGIVLVPILIGLFKFSYKEAAATSLAALQFPVGLPAIIIYAQNGHFSIANATFIAAGLVLGTFVGTHIALKLPSDIFKKLYAFFLLIVVLYLLFKTYLNS